MRNPRLLVPAAAGALLLGGIAVANAANDQSRREPVATAALPDGSTRSFVAGDAGSVEVARVGDSLTVVRTSPNPGWAVEVEVAAGREVEVEFTSGEGTNEVDFAAELEDGEIRVRIRDHGGDEPGATPGTTSGSTPGTTSATTPGSAPTTAPDGDDDFGDDNSGPGNGDDDFDDDSDDDNSGPGNGDDD
jgi:hypothetical protein